MQELKGVTLKEEDELKEVTGRCKGKKEGKPKERVGKGG